MSTNSTPPKTNDNDAPLSAEEQSASSGNSRLAIIIGVIFLLAIVGYLFRPGQEKPRVAASATSSAVPGKPSVPSTQPAEEPVAAPVAPTAENSEAAETPEAPEAAAAAAPTVAATPKTVARPAAEVSLNTRPVEAVAPVDEPVAEVAAPTSILTPDAPTNFTLSGRIFDENGQPLAGATVLLKGSRKGTSTDANGNYSLEQVPTGENSVVYGYGGYEDQEIRTRGSQPVTVTLLPAEGAKRKRK